MQRSIRPLGPDDAAAAVHLIHLAFRAQPIVTDPPSAALQETVDTVRSAILDGGGACCEIGGEIAGVVLWAERNGALYFGRLAVGPGHRRKGIARMLIGAVEAEAIHRSLTRVELGTRVSLVDNHRLFEACGYRVTGSSTHAGFSAPTSIDMAKQLP